MKTLNMTTGSEWKHILLFSLPIMLGNLLQQLYNTVDGIVVGNYVSQDALAAVGTCTGLTMVFLSLAVGLSTGNSIMISQLFGAKKYEDLRRAVSTSLITQIAIGLVLSAVGWFTARPLLSGLLGVTDPDILDMAATYFSIYCLGLIFQFAYNIISAVLRAIGDSRATLYFLCVASVANIVLDLVFVIVFHWAVMGVAVATVISQFACALVSAIYMFKKYELLRFKKGEFVFEWDKCKLSLRLGIPTTIQQCIIAFSSVGFQRLVNSFGNIAMAAYAAGTKLDKFMVVTINGFNAGQTTFTGQNMGAGKIDRILRGHKATMLMSGGIIAAMSLVVIMLAPNVCALFGVDGDALELAAQHVRFLSPCYIIFAVYGSFSSILQGSGDTTYSSLCTLSSLFIRLSVAYALAGLTSFGFLSICYSAPIAWSCALVMGAARYFKGSWKTKSIISKESA